MRHTVLHVRFALDLMPIGRAETEDRRGSKEKGKIERCEWVTMTLEPGDMNG